VPDAALCDQSFPRRLYKPPSTVVKRQERKGDAAEHYEEHSNSQYRPLAVLGLHT